MTDVITDATQSNVRRVVALVKQQPRVTSVADMDALAVGRFRRVLLGSSLVHTPKSHHIMTSTLLKGGGSVIARLPHNKMELTIVAQAAGELSSWIHRMLVSEDNAEQTTLFTQISNRLAAFSHHLPDLKLLGGLVDMPAITPTSALVSPPTSFMAPFPNALATKEYNEWSNNSGGQAATAPVFGALISPIVNLLESAEAVPGLSQTTGSKPAGLGSIMQVLCAQAATITPEYFSGGSIPGGLEDAPEARLLSTLANICDSNSGVVQDLKDNKFWTNWGISGLTAATDGTIMGALNSLTQDIQTVMGVISELQSVISEVEEVWDIISTYGPIILGLLALL